MSSCGACRTVCNCGSGCSCNDCSCCKQNANFGEVSTTTTETVIFGANGAVVEVIEQVETEGCKHGSNCTCNPRYY